MLYQFDYDGTQAIVEEDNIEAAIKSWRKATVAMYGWDGDEEPDTIVSLSSVADIIIGGEVV